MSDPSCTSSSGAAVSADSPAGDHSCTGTGSVEPAGRGVRPCAAGRAAAVSSQSAPGSRGSGSRTSRRTGWAPAADCPGRASSCSRRRGEWSAGIPAARRPAGAASSVQSPSAQPNSGSTSPRIQSTSSRTPSSSWSRSASRNSTPSAVTTGPAAARRWRRTAGSRRVGTVPTRAVDGRCGLGYRHSVTVRHRHRRQAYGRVRQRRRNRTYIRCAHGPSAAVRPAHPRGTRHPVRPAVVHRRARAF